MTGGEDAGSLRERLERVRERIATAAHRAGRAAEEVEVLPVTKGHPAARLREVAALGLPAVGENRVGEAEEKQQRLGRLGLRWHMIGHLQRNKAARALEAFDLLESLDSLRLARRLQEELEASGSAPFPVLVQVNASGEGSKGGFPVHDERSAVESLRHIAGICEMPALAVRGLMTMAPLTREESVLRPAFRRTREMFDRCGREIGGFAAGSLSMGMSNDFEIAVEEGSTRVRLGTVLLGERPGT